jgi:hypothetical protein
MTKEAFTSAAKYSISAKNARYPEVVKSLLAARMLTPASVMQKMTYEEQNQHLINLAWEIYQFNTGIKA